MVGSIEIFPNEVMLEKIVIIQLMLCNIDSVSNCYTDQFLLFVFVIEFKHYDFEVAFFCKIRQCLISVRSISFVDLSKRCMETEVL